MATVCAELAEQFLTLTERQADTVPLTVRHRLIGTFP